MDMPTSTTSTTKHHGQDLEPWIEASVIQPLFTAFRHYQEWEPDAQNEWILEIEQVKESIRAKLGLR